ncbi:hypothetical protein M079_3051 [Bacteroides fragilis str. 3996 N(B) 6]|nr:hypothetical protein M079_3051 [Bacteroides fragilis str. 3996 N(B) 6]
MRIQTGMARVVFFFAFVFRADVRRPEAGLPEVEVFREDFIDFYSYLEFDSPQITRIFTD